MYLEASGNPNNILQAALSHAAAGNINNTIARNTMYNIADVYNFNDAITVHPLFD